MDQMVQLEQPEEAKFDALGLLPGGFNQYLNVIMRVLRTLTTVPDPSIVDVENAINVGSSSASSSVDNYVWLIQRMGLFLRLQNDKVVVKPLGHALLAAPSEFEQKRILAEVMWNRCTGMADILALFGAAARPLRLREIQTALSTRFPTWVRAYSFKERILWWQALDCLVKFDPHRCVLTSSGRNLLLAHSTQLEALAVTEVNEPAENSGFDTTARIDIGEDLIDELQAAALDGDQPRRFEAALAAALSFLKDWMVELKGQPARPEEDVLVRSSVPTDPLTIIFDAKARAAGKLTEINILTLVEYRNQENADGAVVVAADFADGKMVRQAAEQGATLLTVDLLSDLIRLCATTPLALSEYKDTFLTPGLVDALPEQVLQAAAQQEHWAELIAQIIFSLEDGFAHGWDEPVNIAQITTLLFSRLKKRRFNQEAIKQTVELLSNPVWGCLYRNETGAVMLRNAPRNVYSPVACPHRPPGIVL